MVEQTSPVTYSGDGVEIRPDCEEFFLMQFTGLTAKDGADIYGGDIVAIDTSIPPQPYGDNPDLGEPRADLCEVYWKDGAFMASADNCETTLHNHMLDTGDVEVIGNIYENLELLR